MFEVFTSKVRVMRKITTGLLLIICSFCAHAWAAKGKSIGYEECEKQFNKLLQTQVDCALEIKPDALEQIISLTQGVVKDAACVIPLQFPKADVYGQWIKEQELKLPKLQVQCHLTGSNDQKIPVNTLIEPRCVKAKNKDWQCSINMSGTQGLGVLGGVLETQVNQSQIIKDEMKKFLKTL